jgi:TRAP-type C4-dicarboxylate transport system substrate-binding protein
MTAMLKRRLLAGAALAAPFVANPARAQPLQFRITTAGQDRDWLVLALNRFKEAIERDLSGQVQVSVHPNASLFRQGAEVPAVQRGNVEMSTMNTFEVDQQIPELGPYSAGYGFRDWAHVSAVFRGPVGQEYIAAVRERMRIEIIAVTYLGTRQLNLRQFRDARQPSDLAGLRVRMPPGPGWVALGRGLGFTPTPMAIPEVYLALRNGTVDGQDNPVAITRANNFHEVTQQVILTSHLVQPVFYAIGKPWWDRLTPRQQEVFRQHATETAAWNDQQRLADENAVLDFFRAQGLRITSPDLAPFRASVARQYEADGLTARWQPGLARRLAEVS